MGIWRKESHLWPIEPGPATPGWPQARVISFVRDNRAALGEISLYISAYFVYVLTKGLVHSDPRAVGLENAEKVVSLQRD